MAKTPAPLPDIDAPRETSAKRKWQNSDALAPLASMSEASQQKYESEFANLLNEQLARVITNPTKPDRVIPMVHGTCGALQLMDGHDAIEQMLIVQMIGLQNAAMTSMGVANVPGQHPESIHAHLNTANKCVRSFAVLVETLNRHRGKGQQTVRVEHVTIEAGAQAIVGDVHHHRGGHPGGSSKREGQPHDEAEAVRREDENRQEVPRLCDAEREVPLPWREVAGTATRQPERAEARPVQRRGNRGASAGSRAAARRETDVENSK